MSSERAAHSVPPVAVAIAAWLVPGLGFWLLGQRSRGVAVFVSIISLFILGVLIGGIRIVDPPGYGQYGYKVQLVQRVYHPSNKVDPFPVRVDPTSPGEEQNPTGPGNHEYTDHPIGWALTQQFLSEIGNKPWYIGQILCGPVSLAMSAVSLHAAHPALDDRGDAMKDPETQAIVESVPASHSRSWEIGTLYTAVAGMLNLLAIIDSAYRAGATEDE